MMFKKIIAGALAATVIATAGLAAAPQVSALNYDPIKNSSKYYYYCKPGTCTHNEEGKYLGIQAMKNWGFVYSTANDHTDSYKFISITPFLYDDRDRNYYPIESYRVYCGGTKPTVISQNAIINGYAGKVEYQGRIYRTASKSSGILKKYTIGSFRSGLPIM